MRSAPARNVHPAPRLVPGRQNYWVKFNEIFYMYSSGFSDVFAFFIFQISFNRYFENRGRCSNQESRFFGFFRGSKMVKGSVGGLKLVQLLSFFNTINLSMFSNSSRRKFQKIFNRKKVLIFTVKKLPLFDASSVNAKAH